MRKVIAAFNTTIDGNCDHSAGIADEELHQHYTSLLNNAGTILYGRITFELMQYWQTMLLHPSDEQELDEFAKSIDKIPKIVFSQTLKKTNWETAEIATKPLVEVINELKQEEGTDILIGSRSLIVQLMNLNLIDELQLCIQPVIAGPGISLFEDIENRTVFQLKRTKTFSNGAIILYYSPTK
ncbi:dihydrofolate reductase family protein [Sphingobacterium hotanense]|uniref:dihydrofolate reductase family protein n=1 Tax=Sphingobacterium hotanense TaxID=649196 RepID=UPI0021A35872|nr:dihydrofolate reductase family protein [Sphingobacterium hotanense]MCT1524882.1 dihydrofolate reductase family protein [Sphingobacterium hotanense]